MQTAIACGNIEAVLMLIQHGISIQKHDLEYAQKDTTKSNLSLLQDNFKCYWVTVKGGGGGVCST